MGCCIYAFVDYWKGAEVFLKKGIMILLAVSLIIAFLGCQSEDTIQPNYEVLIYGLSDSITGSGLQEEY